MKWVKRLFLVMLGLAVAVAIGHYQRQQAMLAKVIERLNADSRVAQVLVTGVNYNESAQANVTTVKFLEFDTAGKPLMPRYFTFPGNILQFQALVVRFDDRFVKAGDKVRGKSVYLFTKAFALNGENTKEFPITYVGDVPMGYKLTETSHATENQFWKDFWVYAFDEQFAKQRGVKNVQIEAPGTMFIPGYLYTIKIEHDGGLRIDTQPLPEIIRGEKIINQ